MKMKKFIAIVSVIVLFVNCFAFMDMKNIFADEEEITYETICENGWEYSGGGYYSHITSYTGGTSFIDYPAFEYEVYLIHLVMPPSNENGALDKWAQMNAEMRASTKLAVKSPMYHVEKNGKYTISFKQSLNRDCNIKFCVINSNGNTLYQSNLVTINPENPPEFNCDLSLNVGDEIQLCSYIDGGDGVYTSQVLKANVSRQINISCDANGGIGAMNFVSTKIGAECSLPNCTFTAPQGMRFKEWAIGSPDSNIRRKAGETYIFDDDTNIYAIWEIIPDYTIISSSDELDFGMKNDGYITTPDRKTCTITNKGNQTITLSKNSLNNFIVSDFSKTTLMPDETSTFTVQPKSNLGAGVYRENITVCTANDTGISIALQFKVNSALSVIISPASAEIVDGESQILTANAVGGSGNYTYCWYENNSSTIIATTKSITVKPSDNTTYKVVISDDIEEKETTSTVSVKPVITYDANGGSGTMTRVICTKGQTITLPECTMKAPKDMFFKCWAIGSPTSKVTRNPGETYTFNKSATIYAVWYDGLIWSDEFNGTSLDESVWSYDKGNGSWGWGNGEVEYYTDREENVKVKDGSLQITAKRENYGGKSYTSGRIKTLGKQTAKYGLIEARIKVENGNQDGVWPAFWMMGNDHESVGWPYCGEIDIMEHANSDDFVSGYLHWYDNGNASYGSGREGNERSYGYFTDNFNNGINGWHIYGLLWDENHLEWRVDGKTFLNLPMNSSLAKCFKKDHFFLLNLAIGGTGTGFTNYKTANASTFKTTTMYVDYVRQYRTDSKGSVGQALIPPNKVQKAPSTTTKAPSGNQPETVTYTTIEEVDAVLQSNQLFTTYAGSGWSSASIQSATPTVTGVEVEVDNAGEHILGLQAHTQDLQVTSGNTYNLQTTLESDIDKKVLVEVNGYCNEVNLVSALRNAKLHKAIKTFALENEEIVEITSEDLDMVDDTNTFYRKVVCLKAGEPYTIDEDITIPGDFKGTVDIDYAFGKDEEEELTVETFTLKIANTSFTTVDTVVHSELVPTTKPEVTTKQEITKEENTLAKIIATAKIKSVVKKKSAKKTKITLIKKVNGISGYQLCFYKTKKNAKANKKAIVKLTYKKNKKTFTVSHRKLKGKKTLFLRIKAYAVIEKKKVYSKWSSVKKVNVK